MKAGILYLLLLPACSGGVNSYDYEVRWTCRSGEGCERAAELMLIDRANIQGDYFFFGSSRDPVFDASAQRVRSDALPAGCFWLYGLAFDGDELEPAKGCSAPDGYDLEISIPNRNPATHSEWLVEVRELGWLSTSDGIDQGDDREAWTDLLVAAAAGVLVPVALR